MIAEALIFLKNELNAYMRSRWPPTAEPRPDPVDFISGDKLNPLTFNPGAISLLLLNIQEENNLRAPDPYKRIFSDGKTQAVQPELRLNLYILFVAQYAVYQQALENLSLVIQFFQSHRLFKHPEAAGLSDHIEQLAVELITLPFAEQNEVWNALRVTYQPSVLYRVKGIIYRDENVVDVAEVSEIALRTVQR